MTIWTGLGMNYGHDALSPGTYNTAQVESDFTFLKSQGITSLRMVFPGYTSSAKITTCQDMILRALAHGFYVVWGVATGFATGGNFTSTDWTTFKAAVTGSIATWAQANGLSELCLGNEAELQCDNTTITATTIRSDMRAMAASVKSGGYTGKVSYATSVLSTYRAPWASEGIGSLDLFGWNSYDTLSNFQGRSTAIVAQFPTGYVSEFSAITTGYGDYNDENAYATDVLARITSMSGAGIPKGYFFCYRDGGNGLGANTFGIVQTSGVAHSARGAILNTPGQKIFSMFGV